VSGPDTRRLKIAFCTENMDGAQPDPQVKALTEDTAKLCASLGHEIVEIKNPIDGEKLNQSALLLWATMPAWAVQQARKRHQRPEDVLEPWTLGLAAQLEGKSKGEIRAAADHFKMVQRQLEAFMSPYDVWLTPVTFSASQELGYLAPTVPFDTLLSRAQDSTSYTMMHNVAGTPAMSVPLQWSREGSPVGSQFAGKLGAERTLLSLAYELQDARPWVGRRPALNAFAR
jgi:amidase